MIDAPESVPGDFEQGEQGDDARDEQQRVTERVGPERREQR